MIQATRIAAGILGAMLTAVLYVSAVIAFPRTPQPPPKFGVDIIRNSDVFLTFRLSLTGVVLAAAIGFVLAFTWLRRRQPRPIA